MANTFRNDTYSSQKTIAYVVMGFLSAMLLIDIAFAVGSIGIALFPDSQIALEDGSSTYIGLVLIGLASLPYFPVYLGTVITFLIWLYRSFNNLSALEATNLEFSPGWAVGWWFVPFANLIKPFQVIRELWNESDPEFDKDLGFLSSSMGAHPIIGFWWAAFLISGLLFRISNAAVDVDGNIEEFLFPMFFLAASLVNGIAAALAILIVKKINERQEERFKRIGEIQQTEHHLPPEPPVFN